MRANLRQVGLTMHDRDIRTALQQTVLARHVRDTKTRIVHELGLLHGRVRVDIAVVNGQLHGYEIKSEKDRLHRLEGQVNAYSAVLDRATLVTTENHLDRALPIVPSWWGVRVAQLGRGGSVELRRYRAERINRDVVPLAVAGLLWKEEALKLIAALGNSRVSTRMSRREVYELLISSVPLRQLQSLVRATLRERAGWRDHPKPAARDDLSPLPSI